MRYFDRWVLLGGKMPKSTPPPIGRPSERFISAKAMRESNGYKRARSKKLKPAPD